MSFDSLLKILIDEYQLDGHEVVEQEGVYYARLVVIDGKGVTVITDVNLTRIADTAEARIAQRKVGAPIPQEVSPVPEAARNLLEATPPEGQHQPAADTTSTSGSLQTSCPQGHHPGDTKRGPQAREDSSSVLSLGSSKAVLSEDTTGPSPERLCRECGISHIEPGWEIEGEPLCWVDDDLCSRCHDSLQEKLVLDANRYRFLRREWPIDVDNTIASGEDLDRTIDSSMGFDVPQTETLERRLADCLATCIDEPLLKGFLGGDGRIPTEIRLGFFRPEVADRAAELLEEAGV